MPYLFQFITTNGVQVNVILSTIVPKLKNCELFTNQNRVPLPLGTRQFLLKNFDGINDALGLSKRESGVF